MNIEYKDNVLYIKAPNVLVGDKTIDFESKIIPIVLCLNIRYITISLEDIDFIDKKGVNSIIKLSQLVGKNNGKVVLCNLNDYIKSSFKKTDIFDYCFKSKNYKSSLEVFKI